MEISRRNFLKGLGYLGLGAAVPPLAALPGPVEPKMIIIDSLSQFGGDFDGDTMCLRTITEASTQAMLSAKHNENLMVTVMDEYVKMKSKAMPLSHLKPDDIIEAMQRGKTVLMTTRYPAVGKGSIQFMEVDSVSG